MFAPRIPKPKSPALAPDPGDWMRRNPVRAPRSHAQVQCLLQALADNRRGRASARTSPGDRAKVQEAADRGIAGPGRRLPYLDVIQRWFGHHDVSTVVAHTDGRAKAACDSIGAAAFATGSHVAFGSAPSLHTAAHEAAHVVQQRAGVQLRGGVGEAGDAYERQADRVADLVTRGQSAAAVLDEGGAGASAGRAAEGKASPVQRKETGARARVADAPAGTYIVPFDRNPLAAPGERIIFAGEFSDPSPADYRLEYSTTGGHFTTAAGPTARTIAGLISGNVNFFVPKPWNGRSTVQVVLKVRKISDNSVSQTETWNFGRKTRYPTRMTQQETTGERNLPASYVYDITGPALRGVTAPFYEHHTILEKFGKWKLANIVPADIANPYRTTNALTTAAAVSSHFLAAYAGDNGTFTVDGNDQIADQHSNHPKSFESRQQVGRAQGDPRRFAADLRSEAGDGAGSLHGHANPQGRRHDLESEEGMMSAAASLSRRRANALPFQ